MKSLMHFVPVIKPWRFGMVNLRFRGVNITTSLRRLHIHFFWILFTGHSYIGR